MSLAKFDQELSKGKIQYLAGVDEAGRGPLAGPVVAAAIILPNGFTLDSIKDSKKISEGKRKLIYPEILNNALSVGVGIIHENEIDKINILQGTYKAMKIALGRLQLHPDKVIIFSALILPSPSISSVNSIGLGSVIVNDSILLEQEYESKA